MDRIFKNHGGWLVAVFAFSIGMAYEILSDGKFEVNWLIVIGMWFIFFGLLGFEVLSLTSHGTHGGGVMNNTNGYFSYEVPRFYLPISAIYYILNIFSDEEGHPFFRVMFIFLIGWLAYERARNRSYKIKDTLFKLETFRHGQIKYNFYRSLKDMITECNRLEWTDFDFSFFVLKDISLGDVNLKHSRFYKADLSSFTIYNSNLKSTVFDAVKGDKITFRNCNLSNSKFNECDFDKITFENVKIKNLKTWIQEVESNSNSHHEEFFYRHNIDVNGGKIDAKK